MASLMLPSGALVTTKPIMDDLVGTGVPDQTLPSDLSALSLH